MRLRPRYSPPHSNVSADRNLRTDQNAPFTRTGEDPGEARSAPVARKVVENPQGVRNDEDGGQGGADPAAGEAPGAPGRLATKDDLSPETKQEIAAIDAALAMLDSDDETPKLKEQGSGGPVPVRTKRPAAQGDPSPENKEQIKEIDAALAMLDSDDETPKP